MISRLECFLILILFVYPFASASLAQSGGGSVLVTVKDPMESAVVGAEVRLARPSGKSWKSKTDLRGVVQFNGLPAGEYRIIVSAPGFREFQNTNLIVRSTETLRVDAVVEIAPIESEVEIGENEAVSPESAGASVILNENEIEKLPDDQLELERAIKRLGEAVAGEDLPITVNGVPGGRIPPKDAIQQIRVNQNVFSAQYESAFGGGIEIFTRSNVDRFRGYASFSFADSRLNAADPFLGRRVPYQSRSYYFSLSGPLLKKKANFFVFGSRSESDSSAVVNAVVLDTDLRPVEFKQTLATPTRSEGLNVVVNADPNKKHKLNLSYNLNNGRSSGQNVGGFSLPSRANESSTQSHFVQFSDTYLINPNVVNQSRLLVAYFTNESVGESGDAAINVLEAFFGGGSQQNSSSRNLRFDAFNDTTWQMGRYALGFGFRVRGERVSQNSEANFGGTYTFSGRIAPVLDANNEPVLDGEGRVVMTQINSIESYRRTLLFGRMGYPSGMIRELGGGPNQFTISGGNPFLKVTQFDAAFYVQNSYKLSETMAASFGVRYENQTNIGSNLDLAPRFGFIWAPKAKDKQNKLYVLPRVSIGYGLFYSRFALNNTLTVRQAMGTDRQQYLITETAILDEFPNAPTVDLLQEFALPRTQRFISGDLEAPLQSQMTVSVTKPMPKKFSLVFSYSTTRISRQSLTQNINAPLAGTFDPVNPSQSVRPFGNVGNIYETRSTGRSRSERYSFVLNLPPSQKLFGHLRYSYSKAKSDAVSGSGSPFDPYDFGREFGPNPYDGVHSTGGYFYYTLPRKISIGGDLSVNSGTRFNITTGRDTNGDGSYSERPAFATDLSKPGLVQTPYGVLDPNPSPGDELVPRNLGRGQAYAIFNASITKAFGFNADVKNKKPPRQTLNLSFRANNVFNIINKGNPVGNMASPNFLRSLSGFSDGSVVFINGAQQISFVGRSVSLSVGFGF